MFFSAKEFWKYLNGTNRKDELTTSVLEGLAAMSEPKKKQARKKQKVSLAVASKALKTIKRHIENRDLEIWLDGDDNYYDETDIEFYKWLRPWEVVPELKNFKAPKGDFGIGVEVESDFLSKKALQSAIQHIKNWKYIALDEEGGDDYPLEVTFPPFLYSSLSRYTPCMRYLAFLNKHKLVNTDAYEVGIHVNVSVGGVDLNTPNYRQRLEIISNRVRNLSTEENDRYFGRHPYGYGNLYSNKFIEWKLFLTTDDPKRLQQYIDIAVELTKLVASARQINTASVITALEAGYNKSLPQKKKAA